MRAPANTQHARRTSQLAYAAVVVVWIVVAIMNFQASNEIATSRYHLSRFSLHFLQAAFTIPSLFIWLATVYAALSFYRYSLSIKGAKEAPGFRYIGYGLAVILVSMIANSVLSSLQNLLVDHASNTANLRANFVIISNYATVIGALLTYGFLFLGSRSLLESIGRHLSVIKQRAIVLVPFVGLAFVYLWLIFSNPARRVSEDSAFGPTFGLPDGLILLTVAVPYLISWLLGAVALRGLYQYRAKSDGIVYRLLFKQLVIGMTLLIGLTIALQLLTQFANFWSSQGLSSILAIIAVIYIVLVYAFVDVAKGAQQLNKIETLSFK